MNAVVVGVLVVVVGVAAWTFGAGTRESAPFELAEDTLLRAALLGCLVALRQLLASPVTAGRRFDRRVLAGIVLVALGLRLLPRILPWHAYGWFEVYSQRLTTLWDLRWYGNGFFVLVDAARLLGLDLERAVASVNVLGALGTVAAIGWFGTLLSGDRRVGGLAAALLAVQPLHVVLAPSDSMQFLPGLFPVLASAGVLVYARTGALAGLVLAACAAFFGSLSRPEGFLSLVAIPLLLGAPDVRAILRRRSTFVAAVATLAMLAPFLNQALGRKLHGSSPVTSFVVTPFGAAVNAWEAWNSAGAHMAVLGLLALAGPLQASIRARRWEWLAPLAPWLLLAQVAGFDVNFANRWQLLLPQLPWMVLGAAMLLLPLWDGLRSMLPGARWAAPVLGGIVALLFVSDAVRAAPVVGWWDQQDEWAFVHEHRALVDAVTPAAPLVLARPEGDGPFATFPSYLLPEGQVPLHLAAMADRSVPVGSLYFRGLACWNRQEYVLTPEPDRRPTCAAAESAAILAPVAVHVVEAPPFVGFRTPATQEVEIGFFRVTGFRP